jgi:hypothetical protein
MIMKKMHYFRKTDGSDMMKRNYEEEKRLKYTKKCALLHSFLCMRIKAGRSNDFIAVYFPHRLSDCRGYFRCK